MLKDFLIFAYPIGGTIIFLFHFPQMKKILESQTGAQDISIITWATWASCNMVTTGYAWLIAGDLRITLFSLLNALCCFTISGMTIYKRKMFERQQR
jgi:hypothetical protein